MPIPLHDLNICLECFVLALAFMALSMKFLRVHLPLDFRRANYSRISTAGGLCILLAVVSVRWFQGQTLSAAWLIPSLILTLGGLADDYLELRPRQKFLMQCVAVTLFFALKGDGQHLLLATLGCPVPLAYALSGFWIMGIITALNMIDGSDWTAGTIALGALIGAALLGVQTIPVWMTVGALLAFLLVNAPPAKIFLGEGGTSLLAFWLTSDMTFTHAGGLPPLAQLFGALCAFSIPEADTLLAISRRLLSGVSISQGDRGHLHHRLQNLGVKNWALAAYILMCQSFVVLAIALTVHYASGWFVVVPSLALAAFGLMQMVLLQKVEARLMRALQQSGLFAIGASSATEEVRSGNVPLYVIDLRVCYYALMPAEWSQTVHFLGQLKAVLLSFDTSLLWQVEGDTLTIWQQRPLAAGLVEEKLRVVFENQFLRVPGGFAGLMKPTIVPMVTSSRHSGKTGLSLLSDNRLASEHGAA